MVEKGKVSKTFHETIGVGIAFVRDEAAKKKLKEFETGEYQIEPIPVYTSQLADAKASQIEKFYGRIEDIQAAQRFGTEDLGKFSYWAWRSCGIAGMHSILKTIRGGREEGYTMTIMDLIREGMDLKGYDVVNDKGWYHASLVALAERHGVFASMHKFIPASEIALILARNNYVLASVKSDTGGHLLLLYGFCINELKELSGFTYHDPNNFGKNGEANFISKKDFDKITTRRIIAFRAVT
jgi:hypothetical protein